VHRGSWRFLCHSLMCLIAATYFLVLPGNSAAVAAPLSSQQVGRFLADPSAALSRNPDGGAKLVVEIRDLVLSDPATLQAIISLLANANAAQKTAIGSGLGQAAQASLRSNPALANQIQTELAASGDELAIASYSATTGNVDIGSTGDSGGGGVGGPTTSTIPTGGGGGSGVGATGSTGSSSTGGQLTGGGGVSGGSSGSGTTLASSVSPQ
jgi:hypothetical protein